LGHRETHPINTQEALAASHTDKLKLSFLLFDEIEKASDALWQLLLGMLDKATLTLGDNRRVDLSQTVIFLTSNLGGGEITELMQGGMGFVRPNEKPAAGFDEKIERTAVEAARRKFSPEFMNRLDKVVVFHPLRREQLEKVLEIELGQVQQRVLETAKGQFLFRVTDPGRDYLLQEGTDQRYGARHLKRSIERHIVYPLANLLATEQVHLGDLVCIDWNKEQECLTFTREGENLAIPARKVEPVISARALPAKSGKSADAPGLFYFSSTGAKVTLNGGVHPTSQAFFGGRPEHPRVKIANCQRELPSMALDAPSASRMDGWVFLDSGRICAADTTQTGLEQVLSARRHNPWQTSRHRC
jgi:hypothetical protein